MVNRALPAELAAHEGDKYGAWAQVSPMRPFKYRLGCGMAAHTAPPRNGNTGDEANR